RDGVDGLGGGWFGDCVLKKVGDGLATYFWTDTWLDGSPLCVRFRRLFDLAVNQSSTVAEMFSLGWGDGVAESVEGVGGGDVGGVSGFTSPIFFCRPARGYSVRGAYQILTTQQLDPVDGVEDLIWHKQVPLKVSIFAWRLLR
ncbi:kinesin-like protein, partial [Trifolium medium]|nr:kinesin-like protein [Trifolium medium]